MERDSARGQHRPSAGLDDVLHQRQVGSGHRSLAMHGRHEQTAERHSFECIDEIEDVPGMLASPAVRDDPAIAHVGGEHDDARIRVRDLASQSGSSIARVPTTTRAAPSSRRLSTSSCVRTPPPTCTDDAASARRSRTTAPVGSAAGGGVEVHDVQPTEIRTRSSGARRRADRRGGRFSSLEISADELHHAPSRRSMAGMTIMR